MAATPIPTWKERLKACFQWRHRLMHVFGVPSAVGAATAVATASALNPDVGMALGALTAAVGSVLAGYYVTAGFDTKLVKQLQYEKEDEAAALADSELYEVIGEADPALRPRLQRIVKYHANIEQELQDDSEDAVEAILKSSVKDLRALRDRAVSIVKLHKRLSKIIVQSDGPGLLREVERLQHELKNAKGGPVRDALQTALDSTKRTHDQWRAAIEKQSQIVAVLTIIETNLQEFKLAMELRKADAAMSSQGANLDVSELQQRLAAAGQACDQLVGRKMTARQRRRSRS